MQIREIDRYLRGVLAIDDMVKVDYSLNGVQVDNGGADIKKVAFAVDACAETFRRAKELDAGMLFVHHGLFWGNHIAVRGAHYDRLKALLDSGIALYAAHLPLDMHPEFGNNAGMARVLGLSHTKEFGEYKGVKIGFMGTLDPPQTVDWALKKLGMSKGDCNAVLPFGPEENSTVGIVSGGATRELDQAIEQDLDLYITGDASHESYHVALEEGINMICGGHYVTETWGVKLLSERLSSDTGLETIFIDVPTGL